MTQVLIISGKAQQVFKMLEWLARVAGKVTLGDILKYHTELIRGEEDGQN